MTWKCYLAVFEALSPVHIGYKQIGNLKTTRYYITGKAMWGAITASLTRALFEKPAPEDYAKVGNFVREYIKTTYFYPAIEKNKVKNSEELSKIEVSDYLVFLPEYTDNGLKFGELPKELFEQVFVSSFVLTSLETNTKTAEEGSLHEFEFVSDKAKIGSKIHNVYWIGYLFVKQRVENNGLKITECRNDKILIENVNNNTNGNLIDVLNLIQVGGERNYGLGRLKMIKLTKSDSNKIFGKFKFELSNKKILLETLDKNTTAIAHVELDGINLEIGEIEPLVGLEWSEKGAGQRSNYVGICATPGSKINNSKYFIIDNFGILKRASLIP